MVHFVNFLDFVNMFSTNLFVSEQKQIALIADEKLHTQVRIASSQ